MMMMTDDWPDTMPGQDRTPTVTHALPIKKQIRLPIKILNKHPPPPSLIPEGLGFARININNVIMHSYPVHYYKKEP